MSEKTDIMDRYFRGEFIDRQAIKDAIAEMQHLHDLYKVNFQGHSMSVAKDCIDIIRKHTGVRE